jgi:hypothetical protein
MPVEYDEFKGHKMIKLLRAEGDFRPFQFGKSKAKLIIDNYDAIKDFVESE